MSQEVLNILATMYPIVKFPRFSGHILPDRDVQKCWGIDGQEDKSSVHSRV